MTKISDGMDAVAQRAVEGRTKDERKQIQRGKPCRPIS